MNPEDQPAEEQDDQNKEWTEEDIQEAVQSLLPGAMKLIGEKHNVDMSSVTPAQFRALFTEITDRTKEEVLGRVALVFVQRATDVASDNFGKFRIMMRERYAFHAAKTRNHEEIMDRIGLDLAKIFLMTSKVDLRMIEGLSYNEATAEVFGENAPDKDPEVAAAIKDLKEKRRQIVEEDEMKKKIKGSPN